MTACGPISHPSPIATGPWMYVPARRTVPSPREDFRVQPQEVPRVQRVRPDAVRADRLHRAGQGEGLDRAREVVSSLLLEALDDLEDGIVERVRPRVDQVPYGFTGLLHDPRDPVPREEDDPVRRGGFALRDENARRGPSGDEVGDRLAVDEVASVHHEERALELPAGPQEAVGGAELLVLDRILDSRAELLALLEVAHDPLAAVSDDEDHLVDPLVDERAHDMLEDGPVPDGDHHLRLGGREGAHTGSLPGGENDGLHPAASMTPSPPNRRARVK